MGHEDVGIWRGHFGSHGRSLDLEEMVVQKIKVVILKDEVEEGFYDAVFGCYGGDYVPMLVDEIECGSDAFIMWYVGVQGCDISCDKDGIRGEWW